MVAYSFKPSFIEPIRSLEKCQTIRLPRKRHARPGEDLQLFTGPRMKPTRLGAATCIAVHDCRLDFSDKVVTLDDAFSIEGVEDFEALNTFAIRDGFRPPADITERGISAWEYMAAWWRLTHPGTAVFSGVLVDWGETFVAEAHPEIPGARPWRR